ncbi:HTH ArsR-type DNA-binding domain protein [Acididesulfobacillus acetoxydans]|uniref:HTH ArsR-type DNA-binding domain protein n=1 Tax=Acididesulfobacillus acetoxydans TaxID=1561005 RepID=A0A8S0WWM1_9FIRM|nr:autorepressor SdpR family transcription factor [Acididesulfobacillus acetoxydans]CAA7600381.1 HTH ArsR-type DNA-binding domain protein [Acididesulfobacillus acetoxydans]CEJ07903.1 helix_turn_helix, Arsenical Resistance Operon Repressor [Acididesulfobacillus acetoxydans]
MTKQQSTFQALSDPTRRRILRYLREGDLTAGEIAAKFTITKPSISHHLSILKQADLISDRRSGQNIVYSLNTTVFQDILKWFADFLGTEGPGGEGQKKGK